MRTQVSVFALVISIAALWPGMPASAAANDLPLDAKPTCVAPPAEFNSWFEAGSAGVNGIVKPADSVAFPDIPNCSFYKWSAQMFLWLASPTPPVEGQVKHTFDSTAFFDVSPLIDGKRTFIPHTPNLVHDLSVRVAQVGPNELPVILSKNGRLMELVTAPTNQNGKPIILDVQGVFQAVDGVKVSDGHPQLLDEKGNVIDVHSNRISSQAKTSGSDIASRFELGGQSFLIDSTGNVVQSEQGQADNGVIFSQNGSLVYYITIVNDVFAYMRTASVDNGISPSPLTFPTTQGEVNKIVAFAQTHGVTIADASALAIELKSSWVEADTVSDPSKYIIMSAVVPTFDKSDPKQWKPDGGTKSVKLALVGFHVVGSTKGHPEMIWATFEHSDNAPSSSYAYVNSNDHETTVPQSASGKWTFSETNPTGAFNTQVAKFDNKTGNINVFGGASKLQPSNVLRAKPWGAASDVVPNPIDGSVANSNTEIISLNNSVRSQLTNGDVRSNYILIGATWTILGAPPDNADPGQPTNEVGTNMLTNSTMETFQQGVDSTKQGSTTNCFSCHNNDRSDDPNKNSTFLSHVYPKLNPLF
jgi:hypothetical protein